MVNFDQVPPPTEVMTFQDADRNGDGVLTRAEFQTAYLEACRHIVDPQQEDLAHGGDGSVPLEIDYVKIYGLQLDAETAKMNDSLFAKHFPDAHRKMILHKCDPPLQPPSQLQNRILRFC